MYYLAPCPAESRAPVSVAGSGCGAVLPAQVWLPGVSMDGLRDQQTGAGPQNQRGLAGGSRTRGARAAGI